MFQQIIEADKWLFGFINGEWHTPVLDFVLSHIRNKLTSIPLYLFLIYYMLRKRRGSNFLWMVFAGLLPIVTDFISSTLIKKNIWRTRPCADAELIATFRDVLNYCPAHSSSFTSSHATTHMGLAVFFYLTLHQFMGKWAYLFLLWALLIMYAQVYVGMHFPLDIFCGAIIGGLVGWVFSYVFRKKYFLS